MQAKSRALQDFGATFLGPALHAYADAIEAESAGHLPVCLAREGWCFHRLLGRLKREGLIEIEHDPVYLRVSRTLLFRAMLGSSTIMPIALGNDFKGSVLDLMRKRFGLQLHEIFSVLPLELLQFQCELPQDNDKVSEWLAAHLPALTALVAPTRNALVAYLARSGLTDSRMKPLMLDLGYSGTIQKILTHVTKRDTAGLYFIATKPGDAPVGDYHANLKGIFHEGVGWRSGCVMLDRSLLFESLLTAPQGQMVDIRQKHNGEFEFFYGREAATQRHFQDLKMVFDGAIDHVIDCRRHGVSYSATDVQNLYEVFATRPNCIPKDVWHLFSVDDDITGNGLINPLKMFAI
ncbi:HAD family hydrolase [Salinicola aestuarinus]|uniref:HAD family hydrolase n=1 Tax=Salinicola aestuarinus TaxID=1949082 RepID=UPI000DA16163|nr:HAD family hydrolase [Salinicola aestuarinus]